MDPATEKLVQRINILKEGMQEADAAASHASPLMALFARASSVPTVRRGIVKQWSAAGYGCISPDDGGENLCVHQLAVVGALVMEPGVAVVFEAVYDYSKGKRRASSCSAPGGGGGRAHCKGGGVCAEAPADRFVHDGHARLLAWPVP